MSIGKGSPPYGHSTLSSNFSEESHSGKLSLPVMPLAHVTFPPRNPNGARLYAAAGFSEFLFFRYVEPWDHSGVL